MIKIDKNIFNFDIKQTPFDFKSSYKFRVSIFSDKIATAILTGDTHEREDLIDYYSTELDDAMNYQYEVHLNDVLIEKSSFSIIDDFIEREFLVDDLEFLNIERTDSNYNFKPIVKPLDSEIIDYRLLQVDPLTGGYNWELHVDEHLRNGISLDIFTWPLITEDFCDEIITEAELNGNWTTDRHNAYPTHDMLLSSIGYDTLYNTILCKYAHSFVKKIWGLDWDMDEVYSENFIAKYDLESENWQAGLGIHHDLSEYTFVLSLSDNYEGGGTYFPRQKYLVDPPKGYITLHPTLTHRHGARGVTSGIRYVLISFCRKP